MKVIGKTDDGYILVASKDEVANLAGFYSAYSEGVRVEVGREVKVSEMYGLLGRIRNAEGVLKEAAERMKALSSLLELPPVIAEVAAEVKTMMK